MGRPVRRRLAGIAAAVTLACLLIPADVRATDVTIVELMAGANGDSGIQFIVIRQDRDGENVWGPGDGEIHSRAMLVFFDRAGRETGVFRFPESPATGGSLTTLVATRAFRELPGAPRPDILIPPLLNPIDGRVCFRNNPLNPFASATDECVSYGAFREDDPAGGPSAAPLPITGTVSLRRDTDTARSSDFSLRTPAPVNLAGDTFTIPPASLVEVGKALFSKETFSGNGRTCATCHDPEDGFRLSPGRVQARFETLAPPSSSFDPLFIAESAASGFDFGLNTLILTGEVETPAPCTGELGGILESGNGGRARVLARVSPTRYRIYGGLEPILTGRITDGICRATVANVVGGDLATTPTSLGIDDPSRMRERGPEFPDPRALILENIDGFENPPVFRRSPHLINLAYTAPYGFSNDVPDLRSFTLNAVAQHLPRSLARTDGGPDPDYRLPTAGELAALEAYMLAQEYPAGEDPNKFDPSRFATTEAQRRGREEFVVFGCAACHGGPALSQTTISIQGKEIGINASFNTGSTAVPTAGALPCEPPAAELGVCGSREFATPQLFDLPNLGPYFHAGSAPTLAEAVDFYASAEFGNSPVSLEFIATGVGLVPTDSITAFLEGLVVRPYGLDEGPLRFGNRDSGSEPAQGVTIRNTGAAPLSFDASACRLAGADRSAFRILDCPLAPALEPGASRTIRVAYEPDSDGLASAILEVHPLNAVPSGIDLYGAWGAPQAPPIISRLSLETGSTAGGDSIVVVGSDFAPGALVIVGGVRAGFTNVLAPTVISARTGTHAPGTVEVVVVNPDGQQGVLPAAFTYAVADP